LQWKSASRSAQQVQAARHRAETFAIILGYRDQQYDRVLKNEPTPITKIQISQRIVRVSGRVNTGRNRQGDKRGEEATSLPRALCTSVRVSRLDEHFGEFSDAGRG